MRQQLEMLRGGARRRPVGTPPAPPHGTLPLPGRGRRADAAPAPGRIRPLPPAGEGAGRRAHARAAAGAGRLRRAVHATHRGSKGSTAAHRPHLADPRTVAGSASLWKEIVYPIVTTRSSGSRLWDIDGNEYVDLTNGFGTNLFGHNPRFVREALRRSSTQGIEIGPQTPLAGEVAGRVAAMVGMERVAFCNTGSEAVTAAMRLARTVTGRDTDRGVRRRLPRDLRRGARPPTRAAAARCPIAPGIPHEHGRERARARLRQARGARRTCGRTATSSPPCSSSRCRAAVPSCSRASSCTSCAPSRRRRARRSSSTRSSRASASHPGGAQALFGVRADIATYGKVVGGGLPIGVVAGDAEYMDALDGGEWQYGDDSIPEVGVTFFAGTFVRHPLALAAATRRARAARGGGPGSAARPQRADGRARRPAQRPCGSVGAPVRVTHFSSWFYFNFPTDVPHAGLFHAYDA